LAVISSIVIWTEEPFDQIRAAVESSLHLHKATKQDNFFVARFTSILSTIYANTENPSVTQWIKDFTSQCDSRGLEFNAYRFDPSDPMQTLSSRKNHILESSIRYLGDQVILYDVPFSESMAEWLVQKFLPLGWPINYCLATVKCYPKRKIHIAFSTSTEAYLTQGLLRFTANDLIRRHGLFGKTSHGINSLDDLCYAMARVAKRNGWQVRSFNY